MRRLLRVCHQGEASFSADPRVDAFRQGEQNVGAWIVTALRTHAMDLMRVMEDEERKTESDDVAPKETE